MAEEFKYKAFISYNHKDTKWAAWLHKALESYRVPTPLVGAQGRDGPVPQKLYPIYRDRDESASSSDLDRHIAVALEMSAFLIVICSPHAVASRWVNEEILRFKRMGRENRILAVIVDGEPNATGNAAVGASLECFPEALRFRLDATGAPGVERMEPVAADARPEGDGKINAKLKLVAGILGVDYAALKRRDLAAERRRRHVRDVGIGAMLLLTAMATSGAALAYHYMLRSETMTESAVGAVKAIVDQAVTMSNQVGVPQSWIEKLLVLADDQLSALYTKGLHTTRLDAQHAEILLAFADHYRSTGDTKRRRASAERAVSISERLTVDGRIPEYEFLLARSHESLGKVMFEQSETGPALAQFREEQTLIQQLIATNPANESWLFQLSLAEKYAGDVLEEQNVLDGALAYYRANLRLAQRLASAHSQDTEKASRVAAAYEGIGGILSAEGRLQAAADSYNAGLDILRRLAMDEPDFATWTLDESIFERFVGDTEAKLGDLDGAFQHYVAGMAEARRLVQSDSANAWWLRELAGSQEELAGADMRLGRLEPALTGYAAARAILMHLVRLDPSNSDRREDLAVDDSNMGWALSEKGRYAEAVASHGEAISIMAQLVASDPGDASLQQELADMLAAAADSWKRLGKESTARSDARRAQDILLRLARVSPQDADLQDDLACDDKTLGEVEAASGRIDLALQSYRASFAIRQTLDARDPSNLAWRENYAKLLTAMAEAESKQQNGDAARKDAVQATAILHQLIKRSQTNVDYRHEMSEAQQIGHQPASGQAESTVTPSAAH